jgi:hypothetical protein
MLNTMAFCPYMAPLRQPAFGQQKETEAEGQPEAEAEATAEAGDAGAGAGAKDTKKPVAPWVTAQKSSEATGYGTGETWPRGGLNE